MSALRVGIVGAAGYIGGELARILLQHPRVELAAVTSTSQAGRRLDSTHPNLRGRTDLTFHEPAALDGAGTFDVLFLAVPHRSSMRSLAAHAALTTVLVDLSGDFRLADPQVWATYYGVPHEAPDAIPGFVRGLPETHREALRTADRIAVPGCMATAAILALHPPAADGLIDGAVSVDARTGSSGSGVDAGPAGQHAERSGALRVYAPFGHRHEAEIAQATGLSVRMTVTGIEAVRGVQVVCRARLAGGVDERALRRSYAQHYGGEPFARVVAARRGLYRLPEPKILAGSNHCDVGFAVDPTGTHALFVAALDNLVKGGAGGAVQAMNVRYGWPEDLGLDFPGLHPC